ncbi:preprotein translocase subunit SecE [Candidatus Saccharibacteria bacterium]|nr:preprotein translocase subunit SecE [Candidatus Saccharibacteria bacterium]
MAKTKITRIKASDSSRKEEEAAPITRKKVVIKDKKSEKTKKIAEKKAIKSEKEKQKKGFILFRPFVALFNYLRDSWREIRQVRWPNRKATWKMVLAVLVYTAIFIILISLLDLLFTWLSSLIIK